MKIVSFLDKHLEEVLLAILLSVMTLMIFMQIVFRVFGWPLSWTEELGRYMFIWMIYLGAASAIRKRKHISVELLDLFLKDNGKFVLNIISNVIFMIFAAILTYYSIPVVQRVAAQLSPAVRLSMAIPYSSVLVGSALMLIRLIQDTIARFRERKEAVGSHD
ncbi:MULTISPECIES: TRAP transporter small permease [unclassified Oscillibacter]|uniref:TRAP transporter small permease n=1 Tax=unclassified Oscillibacter TaxID=2629304 RepID=UPI0025D09C0F|nr:MULTISPECIES: TRAP transporter small permease [unclassified Oscillibacter]